jgi:hypothetical protein
MTAPAASTRALCIQAACLLSLLVNCTSFVLQTNFRSCSRNIQRESALRMGYLDDLSPDQPNQKKQTPASKSNKKPSGGGLVPSGRGPEGSYLDAMTGGGNSEASASEKKEDFDQGATSATPSRENKKKPASWSGSYLTDFLTGQDDARTDIRNLLTQRSIQSFMFLLEQVRDPHSAKWIQEDFLQTGNLLEFHGTGAGFIEDFGGTWDAALMAMIQTPKETMIISAKRRGRGHGGWSKNNPYLEERWMEMPIEIDPSSLASRILSVREQIAAEWVKDLDILVEANDMILDSYFARIRSPSGEHDVKTVAFERTAVNLMNDNSRFAATASSPYRRSNFDLLYNLCTQAAIHRLLREKKAAGEERGVPFCFLRDYYTQTAEHYFDGDLPYGRADDFIDELLQTAPSLLTTEDGKNGLVDPVGAAEDIIRMRKEVAMNWKTTMQRASEDHTEIRVALLSNQMQTISPTAGDDLSAFQ